MKKRPTTIAEIRGWNMAMRLLNDRLMGALEGDYDNDYRHAVSDLELFTDRMHVLPDEKFDRNGDLVKRDQ